jgi:hypothetical protein
MRVMGLGLGCLLMGCAPPHYARYASWEPAAPQIPVVADRALGRKWLSESRELWNRQRGQPPDRVETEVHQRDGVLRYTYVRAFEREDGRVDFTLESVERERVVFRALIRVDARQLERSWVVSDARSGFETRWVEDRGEVGSHDEGAPVATIEQLYDRCDELLALPVDAAPRLYFHPDGLLMHCGYLAGDCDDCQNVSIQSASTYFLTHTTEPARRVCVEPWGLFPPLGRSFTTEPNYECWAPPKPRPKRTGAPRSICDLDPSACGTSFWRAEKPSAVWVEPKHICSIGPVKKPSLLDVGKRDPLAEWSYPFRRGAGIECGNTDKQFLFRVQPTLN